MEQVHNLMVQFGFSWPKFFAQIILFLTVYGILSKFAFGPIIKMLEERRRRIEEGQTNAEKIKRQLAEAERRYQEIVQKGSAEAQAIVEEARKSGEAIVQKHAQEAVTQAQEIIQKAHTSIEIERNRMESEVRTHMVDLVVNTTRKVTGKVLTKEDQERLNQETVTQLAA